MPSQDMQSKAYTPFGPEVLEEPSSAYSFLHSNPVYHCTAFDPPFYTLSQYDDVTSALRDIKTFSSEFGQGPRFTDPAGMLSDPPEHTYFRSLVQQAFTPTAIKQMQQRIQQLAIALLEDRHRAGWDIHDDLAFPLPVIIISEMLGVPASDIDLFKHWSDASVAAMGAEDPSMYSDDLTALADYLMDAIAQRRNQYNKHNPPDLITRLVDVRTDSGEGLNDTDILRVVSQLLVGGNETTTSLVTNAVWRLLDNRTLWEQVCSDPEALIPIAIEESLRFDPPVLGLYRSTTTDVTLHDIDIPKNSKVMLHYAAANRDPNVFSAPNTFTLQRDSKRHLAFGLGVHFCLGAQLARMEAEACLAALVSNVPDIRTNGASTRIAPFFLWGRKTLPVSG